MSHFTVLVIGSHPEKQMQAFHEFECTGTDDEYVQDIDITEDLRQEYAESTTRRLKSSDGKLYEPWADEFYREPLPTEKVGIGTGFSNGISYTSRDWNDGKGYRPKVQFIPEGYTELDVPQSELMTFAEYCIEYSGYKQITPTGLRLTKSENSGKMGEAYKYGYTLLDESSHEVIQVINRTNPNKKWDWYVLGGRWAGFFKMRPDKTGIVGAKSFFGPNAEPQHCDQGIKAHIDFEYTRNKLGIEAGTLYDTYLSHVDICCPHERWTSVRDRIQDIETAREFYKNQPRTKAFEDARKKDKWFDKNLSWSASPDEFDMTRDEYVSLARNEAGVPFAIIKDGQWYEKGKMGWWGIVHDEKDQEAWNKQFQELMNTLPDETLLSLYDCHI